MKPIVHLYLPYKERGPEILETLRAKPSLQGKIPTFKGFKFTTHYYIIARPPFLLDMHNSPILAV